MRRVSFIALTILLAVLGSASTADAQKPQGSMYGEAARADVRMPYVYTMEEAFSEAHKTGKPIFFNCFADWALPCHAMNRLVFSDQAFCDLMGKNFVNLFMDLSRPENESIARKYGVQSFAHFLVLDPDGNLLLRIAGGKEKDEMLDCVKLALNPKTSLPGATEIYRSGKRGKKETYNYMRVLDLADDREEYAKVSAEYMKMLKPKEYSRKENFDVFRQSITGREDPGFRYLLDNKADFVKSVGERKVNSLIESFYYRDVMKMAAGETPYDKMAAIDLYNGMQRAGLADTCNTMTLYPVIAMRGERRYDQMYRYLLDNEKRLGQSKYYVDLSLERLPDLSGESKGKLIEYLTATAERYKGSGAERQIRGIIRKLNNPDGIRFETSSLAEARAKAARLGKPLFVDCYTTWCGPCRKMANEVFVLDSVGRVFNDRFVCIKVDMEQAEGRQLGREFNVEAYPTLLFIAPDGTLLSKTVGAQSPASLLRLAATLP